MCCNSAAPQFAYYPTNAYALRLLYRSTIQLLRIPFSLYLMPVYWFALSFAEDILVGPAVLLFVIIHLLVYPASNGYNSFMDRDTDSIGGVEKPLQPTRQLYVVTLLMDVLAVLLSAGISAVTAFCIFIYIASSRLYSSRSIRLKKYAIAGYILVVLNQGGLIFFTVFNAVNLHGLSGLPWQGLLCACLLIGGFYPITQVYQHRADAHDNVKTISMLLGRTGTFVFCGVMYAAAFVVLGLYFNSIGKLLHFYILLFCFVPVLVYFTVWFLQVYADAEQADFKHTMRMNQIASACTNAAFIIILILNTLG